MITKKERGLIKGGIRRVFSRSELRRVVIDASRRNYTDGNRPRVKKWSDCPVCERFVPTYLMEVDHITPIVPLDRSLEDMSWDEIVNRIWCDPGNLKAVCKDCHKIKTKAETKERAIYRKKAKKAMIDEMKGVLSKKERRSLKK